MRTGIYFLILAVLLSTFNLEAEEPITLQIKRDTGAAVFSTALSPDGRYLASCGMEYRVRLWDVSTGNQCKSFTSGDGYRRALVFSTDGKKIIAANDTGSIDVWDIESGKLSKQFNGPRGINSLSTAQYQSTMLMVSGHDDGILRVWDMEKDFAIKELVGHKGEVNATAISPDGKTVISGSTDSTLKVWKLPSGNKVRDYAVFDNWLNAIAFSPNGDLYASVDDNGKLSVFKTNRKPRLTSASVPGSRLTAVSFVKDRNALITGGNDNIVRLWHLKNGKLQQQREWSGHLGNIYSVTPSADGKTLFSGSEDGTIKIWNTEKRLPLIATLVPFKTGEWLSYSPDNIHICSPGAERYMEFSKGGTTQHYTQYSTGYKRSNGLPVLAGFQSPSPPTPEVQPVRTDGQRKGGYNLKAVQGYLKGSRTWAVVIGINDYTFTANGFSPLPYAQRDARAVADYLTKYMGVAEERIFTLYNQKATKKAIEELMFDKLRKRVAKKDRVLVYFSGHGQKREEGSDNVSGYLIPVDGNKDRLFSSSISMSSIKAFSDNIVSKQVLIIIDSCFSGIAGTVFRKGQLSEQLKNEVTTFMSSKGRIIMTAGTSGENSYMDSRWNNHSVYTYFLLQGLEGKADQNHDNVITTLELQLYVSENVSRATQHQQTPQRFNLSYGEGQFVFYKEGEF